MNNQRLDPRFSGGRGRGRGPTNSAMAGRNGAFGRGGPRPMNGGRGGGPMNNFPPPGRGGPPFFGGRNGNFQQRQQHNPPFHRNQKNMPPQPQHQNHNNNFSHGPPAMRGGPPMAGRGRMNMGYNSFNDGRGRGRGRGRNNNMPGRHSFGARGGQHQRPPPPPPRGGRGMGQGNFFPPPPPPQFSAHQSRPGVPPGPNGARNPNSQPRSPPSQYGMPPGLPRGNQMQQAPNGFSQQHPHQQQQFPLASNSAAPSLPTNNNGFVNYPQSVIPAQSQFPPGMQQQVPSTILPSNGSSNLPVATPSTVQIEEAWKEYTAPGGVKYYHNELLKESTYTMPDALKKKTQPTPTTETKSSSNKRSWSEHEDVNTGKKYYSDGVQTTWEKPEGFISAETIVANTSFVSKREESEGPTKKKKKTIQNGSSSSDVHVNENTFANKKEATTAFKGFLLAKGISPTSKWNEVLKACESDAQWESFQKELSMGERRQALAEYQTKRTNEIRNEQRQERIRAKEAFGQLLADVLPSISGFSARASRFADVRNALSKDDRFFAVEEEGTRESLFLDFCDDFKKREERNKRNKRREAQESFVSFLKEREEGGTLTFASTWESFLLSLTEEDKADARFATSQTISDADRQLYFADFVIDLQKVEDDKRRRIQDARRRAEKAQRDQYRELLHKMSSDGKIFPYTRWREIEESLLQEESFKLVEAQDRGSPREIFEVFVDEWDELYRRERNFLSRLLRPPGKIPAGTDFEAFKTILTEESAYSSEVQDEMFRIVNRQDPVSSAKLLFDEITAQTSNGGSRRGSTDEDSSEDEGEIIEDGEVVDNDGNDDNDDKDAKSEEPK